MRTLIWRELLAVWRNGAFWAGMSVYVSVLAVYVLVWSDGLPIAGGRTSWDQFWTLQRTLLMLALPWIAARCATTRHQDLAMLAFATASSPSRLLMANCAALTVSLALFSMSAAPIFLLIQQITASSLVAAAAALAPIMGASAFVAVTTTVCALLCNNALGAWMIASAVTITFGLVLPLAPDTVGMWGAASAAAGVALLHFAGIRLWYLTENSV